MFPYAVSAVVDPRRRAAVRGGLFARLVLLLVVARVGGCGLLPEVKDATARPDRRALYKQAHDALLEGNYTRRSSSSRRSRRAFRTAATRSRRSSSRRTRTTAPAKRPTAVAACDRFIRTYPNHPNVDYAYYLKGLVHFREDQGILGYVYELDLSEREPKGMRESFLAFKELVDEVPGQPLRAGRDRPDALPDEFPRDVRGEGRALLLQSRRVRRGGQSCAGVRSSLSADAGRTRTRSTSWSSYDKLGLTQLRDDTQQILQRTFPKSEFFAAEPKPWWKLW